MPTLAESVISGAQNAAGDVGKSVGDAVTAYHVAATAEHARQELEMEKQNQQMNKANFIMQGITKASTLTGPLQKQYIQSFAGQWKRMDPNADTAGLESLKMDPEAMQKYIGAMHTLASTGNVTNADQADYISRSGSLEGVQKMIDDHENHVAMIESSRLKAQSLEGRVLNGQDQLTQGMLDKWTHDPKLPNLIDLGNKLDRDHQMLTTNDPNFPVTYQAVHEVISNIATVLGNGTASDTSRREITPMLGDEKIKALETAVTNNPNKPASPELVKFALHMTDRLNSSLDNQVAARSAQIANSRDITGMFHNPAMRAAAQSQHAYYKSRQWRVQQALGEQAAAPQPQAPQAAVPPASISYGSTPKEIEANYQQFLAQKAHQTAAGQ